MTTKKPKYLHDCETCRFLGNTIGGGKIFDLYAHDYFDERSPVVIARYSDNGPDYYSSPLEYARPDGHAELWVAATMVMRYMGIKI